MKIEDAYIGLKVKALNSYLHEKYPKYFPKEGTKGKIVAIYNDYETVYVRWKKVLLHQMILGIFLARRLHLLKIKKYL
mgnify:CR=1 FL=1|nr:MAG TPA: hypothetical protein [Caudoviricetes sp.]